MAENKGWGLDDRKGNLPHYEYVTTSTTPDPDDRAYEVILPPPLVGDSEIEHHIFEITSSIHSDSNEHNAFYVQTVVEKVELEMNYPISAPKATLLSLNDIKEKAHQNHTSCCLAKLPLPPGLLGKPQ